MPTDSLDNGLCSCSENEPCANCRFCERHNTPQGRKALCERVVQFLVVQPFYQRALKQAMDLIFPGKVISYDQEDICRMLFESVLFEDTSGGITPLSYFIEKAPLSADERRLYQAWQSRTRYQFFTVDRVTPGKEIRLTGFKDQNPYRVYEHRGATTIKEGSVVVGRIVPFLKGWMFSTEVVLSFPGRAREQLRNSYGLDIPQWLFVRKYHEEKERRTT